MDLGIEGRVAVVTGADSGIGLASALELLREGARVVLTDTDEAAVRAAAESLGAPAGSWAAVGADLTRPDDVAHLVRATEEAFGPAGILVHAAGIHGAQGLFHEIDDDGWLETLQVDLLAAVRTVRALLPGMRAAGWGRIVLISSENGLQPYVDELPYNASKAALLNLTKGLSKTYGSEGVLVNAVSPAFVETPMTDEMMDARAAELGVDRDEAVRSFLAEERPFIETDRRGRPEEVAAVVALLCSARASYVIGSNYRVDGGSVATI
ncbi:SDR family oxidoreductase [Isoptericola halotolerans]|uniref:NAD(P)-dependent dehydrogenase (Short-subunit alcohol dehydrogenase family) n=1 Tax=Isoptericola halotolerans TaxID=300560 RepID=A0ABX1ZXX7_9MICO|nr:NAD(P)-dependent dehydrogenase (short-subunit alcohol dehydrogenase family) [Isoptericola halotolerans]